MVYTHKLLNSLAWHFADCDQLGQRPSLHFCSASVLHCPDRTRKCYCLPLHLQTHSHFGNHRPLKSSSSHPGYCSVNACPLFDYSCGARSNESVSAFFTARPSFHPRRTLMHHYHSSWIHLDLASALHGSYFADAPRALHVKDLRSLVGLPMRIVF